MSEDVVSPDMGATPLPPQTPAPNEEEQTVAEGAVAADPPPPPTSESPPPGVCM